MKKPPAYLDEVIEYVEANLDDPVKVGLALASLLTDPASYKTKIAPTSALAKFVSQWLIANPAVKAQLEEPDSPVSRVLIKGDWVPIWREARAVEEAPSSFKYNVCISFAGKDRAIAEGIAKTLTTGEITRTVFYDEFEKTDLWGENLFEHLHKIYSTESMYCVILFSHAYLQRAWTRHELKSAQTRLLLDRKSYVLPVAIDKGAIPDEFSSVGYWTYFPGDQATIAEAIEQKINDFIGAYYLTVEEIAQSFDYDAIAEAVLDGFKLGLQQRLQADSLPLAVIAMIAGADTSHFSDPNVRALVDLVLHSSGSVASQFDTEDRMIVFGETDVRRAFGVHGPLLLSKKWMEHVQPYIDRWEAFKAKDVREDTEEESD
jgi:hypothetical protein